MGKESIHLQKQETQAGMSSIPRLGRYPGEGNGRRKWQPTPVSLPGESHGQRSLAGYSPRGRMTEATEGEHEHVLNNNLLNE